MTAHRNEHHHHEPHKKIMDPRKLLSRRYSLMFLHFGIIIALILVSTLNVRSAILLGIHGTSALMFLIYVPPSAWLTWREGRNGTGYGAKVKKKKSKGAVAAAEEGGGGEADVELEGWEGGVRRGWTWDCAGLEVAYLGIQCGGTLVSSVLCALTLSSSECFGPEYNTGFVLDEFELLKERGTGHWCNGVIGATILSFVQFGLDLAWLGWVISVVRAGSGVRSGAEGALLSRRASIGVSARPGSASPDGQVTSPGAGLVMSPTSTVSSSGMPPPRLQPQPHVYHLLQTLLTPTPRLLTALAERRKAAEADTKRREAGAVAVEAPVHVWQVGASSATPGIRIPSSPGVRGVSESPISPVSGRDFARRDEAEGSELPPQDLVQSAVPAGDHHEVPPPYREGMDVPVYPGSAVR